MTKLYCRLGDAGDYQEFDGIDDLADFLADAGVDGPIDRHGLYGVEAPGYYGNNYISLYWGSDVESPTDRITNEELDMLNELVEDFATEYDGW